MADPTGVRRSPLAGTAYRVKAPDLSMQEDPFRSMVEVRHPERPVLPDTEALIWRLGPTWWLVDGPPPPGLVLEVPLADAVRQANPRARVTDVSAQRTVIELGGARARDVLAHGCPLDLEQIPVPGCAQGDLAGAQVILGRPGPDGWRVYVRASFAAHLATWLLDASIEYR